jgi:ribonuclease HI
MVARPLSLKVYFDGGCAPNPGAMRTAVVMRGVAHLDLDAGDGSSGEAEWLGLLHALELASAAGERDVVVLGDSASVVDQAADVARPRVSAEQHARFIALRDSFDRLRFRRIKRSQNLAGIALEQVRRRSPQR